MQLLAEVFHMLSNKNATIQPNGYAPIDHSPIADFGRAFNIDVLAKPVRQLKTGGTSTPTPSSSPIRQPDPSSSHGRTCCRRRAVGCVAHKKH